MQQILSPTAERPRYCAGWRDRARRLAVYNTLKRKWPVSPRLFALVVVAALALAANAYAQLYWAGLLFPRVIPRPYVEMVSAAIAGSIAAAVVSAFPLAKLFRAKAWLAGLVISLPVVVVRAPEIGIGGLISDAVAIMAWVEMISYTTAVVGAAWFLSRRCQMAENAL